MRWLARLCRSDLQKGSEGVKKSPLRAFRSGGFSPAPSFQQVARLKAASTKGVVDFFTPSQPFRQLGQEK
jgi:hypothetical protein